MGLSTWDKIRAWLAQCAAPHCVYVPEERSPSQIGLAGLRRETALKKRIIKPR